MPHPRTPGLDRAGRSELHYAAGAGDVGLVLQLIERGAEVDLADSNGWTPLHFAAQAQSVPVIRSLISSGAAVDSRDKHGNTPLSTATFNSRGKGEAIAALRAAGADPLLKNFHGVSAVSLARTIANFPIAQHFADLPAEPEGAA
jgi:ankyrin repeat protein